MLEPTTGRVLEVSTTEPDAALHCKHSMPLENPGELMESTRFCLKTQHYPDQQAPVPFHDIAAGRRLKSQTGTNSASASDGKKTDLPWWRGL
jgi:hypothetical protein